MDHIPVEVIGHVLSLIGDARHVVIASVTCRKWRQAFYNYLHTLKFDDHNKHTVYGRFSGSEIETLISNTIFQTTGLQCLSISMDGVSSISAAFVIDWLIYTGKTLRKLHFNLRTTPNFNILDKFDVSKMELLDLAGNTITITSGYGIFLCLRCLSLSHVVVSPLDLSLLLSACPNMEVFNLDSLEFVMSHETTTIEFTTSTLKEASLQYVCFDNFILKADNLEKLQVRKCSFTAFDLLGKGTLRFLEIEYVIMSHFDIGENFQNLEVVNVNNHQVIWENFHHMIARSAGLTRLKLWFPGFGKILNMESISACFPLLSHLALKYDLTDESSLHWNATDSNLGGSYHFGNVVVLELQCLFINSCFPLWLEELLKRCPKLRKLVICGLEFLEVHVKCSSSVIERANLKAQQLDFGMSCISKLMTKYEHVTVQFRYI
ncbi:hypothetical protein AgCh_019635 [Apium graveolens]